MPYGALIDPCPCKCGNIIRADTRLYRESVPDSPTGNCIGIIWMCNPGSAGKTLRGQWRKIPLDPTLAKVERMFGTTASGLPRWSGTNYIQVLNLFYIVNANPSSAWSTYISSNCQYTEVPAQEPLDFAVFAWGHALKSAKQIALAAAAISACSTIPRSIYSDHQLPSAGYPPSSHLGCDHPSWPYFNTAGIASML